MKLTVRDKYFLNNNKLFLLSLTLLVVSSVLAIISMFIIKSINIEFFIYILSLGLLYPLIVSFVFENTNVYCEREGIQKILYYIINLCMLILSLFIITSIKF